MRCGDTATPAAQVRIGTDSIAPPSISISSMRIRVMDDAQRTEDWPPPPHEFLAGVSFVLAIDAVAWRAWPLVVLFALLAAVAAFWRHITH